MTTVYDVEPGKLISAAADELKKNDKIKPPKWGPFVKTGTHVERIPDNPDWWYVRCASLLRKTYVAQTGVSRLRTAYGGRKNKGYKPEKFVRASGNIIRKGLQQLEAAGLVKKAKKGREVTPLGREFLDGIAFKVSTEAKAAPTQ